MLKTLSTALRKLLEDLDLGWLVPLAGSPASEDSLSPTKTIQGIHERLADLASDEELDEALRCCEHSFDRDGECFHTIESRALTLITLAGVAIGLLIALAGLLFGRGIFASLWFVIPVGVLYLLAVVFLAWTIYLAVRVITGDDPLPYPNPAEILDDLPGPVSRLKRQRIASLLRVLSENRRAVAQQAGFLRGAQRWFARASVLLLILTLLAASHAFVVAAVPGARATPTPTPTPTPSSTCVPAHSTRSCEITRSEASSSLSSR